MQEHYYMTVFLKGLIVFNLHQFRRLATLGVWGIFLLTPTVFAQMKTMPEFMPPEASHQAVVKLTQERVDVLQKKLNLQSDQVAAWSVWSTVLLMDVKQQRMEDLKAFENSREHAMDNSSTPQKIRYQEKRLQFHIERLQLLLKLVEAARLNTDTFYQLLSKDQPTIFDLFWGNQVMREHGVNWLY